jgi:hypothetical protein
VNVRISNLCLHDGMIKTVLFFLIYLRSTDAGVNMHGGRLRSISDNFKQRFQYESPIFSWC